MFKHVICKTPGKSMINGLTSANLGKPDYLKSLDQHNEYIRALQQCDVTITLLPADERFPDSVFVEDTALCTPHCAIITRPGAESRRGETESIEQTLSRFYPGRLEHISAPDTVEAGDIMMVGSHYYIGLSARTNRSGAERTIAILNKYGMTGSIVSLKEVLHLKTGLAYLENNNLLAAGEFVHKPEFQHLNIIEIPREEAYAANSIWVNDRVIMPAGYPETREKIAALGYQVIEVDTSEYRKIDGGVSCMSLRF
ncbi:N(G),N(G)-dimethylarginine dimethylaminohydrolase [Escherichia alba]|uniref:N(G),N(G)-dimethylarginine dimethylaminohydrolase n=2 Tax=Intestinirhabdus alba TaxID=2899544 RepID=A0A6L6INP7_9ENTR|nr:dimethylargininase [Intestinirhabdus alba]MTH47815.1 N(G),N(G)-dimethylarginine dimethylaminohydrolase [Intestinirhabdus alba]